MNWRMVLGVTVSALLPVPLLLVLLSSRPGAQTSTSATVRVSPVLSFEERMQRVTYHRQCRQGSDCEPPMGCLIDARVFTHYCTDSQCMTDSQCPDGLVCRELDTVGDGPLVRFCIPQGERKEGEECLPLPSDRKQACAPGLLCANSGVGWCGRPCRKDEPSSCPDGFFCGDVPPQPICLPTCEARGCPDGQQCLRHEDGVSQCAVVYGPHCQQSPCPEGRQCRETTSVRKPGKAWTECVEECGPGKPTCPDGFTCDRWHCLPHCAPNAPNTCAEGYRCRQGKKPDRPWVCQPDR
jgi:hypothetical protein